MRQLSPACALVALPLAFVWSFQRPAPAAAQQPPAAVRPASPAQASCSKIWVGHEAEYEAFLRTAEVERFEDIPIGVTRPKRARFRAGSLAASAAWKPLRPGIRGGFWESYKSEIAAYELDKLLGLHMVPPAVERVFGREYGALILWVEQVRGWKPEDDPKGPDAHAWAKELVRRKMFDNLIGNGDRNQGNLLYDAEYHLVLIDHSRALTTSKDMPVKLGRFDMALWERMEALTYDQLEPVLSRWMGRREIQAILVRRDRMKKELDALLANSSPYAVFLR